MMKYFNISALASLMLIGAPMLLAQEDEKVKKDLSTVIALQNKPCGEVVSLQRMGENDYLVSCRSGHRYRVFVSESGRVKITELDLVK